MNNSQKSDPRFWVKWRESGAVYAPRTARQQPEYLVQCISGEHIFYAPIGSDLERRCIAHAKRYLDALAVPFKDCTQCVDDWRRREAYTHEMLSGWDPEEDRRHEEFLRDRVKSNT